MCIRDRTTFSEVQSTARRDAQAMEEEKVNQESLAVSIAALETNEERQNQTEVTHATMEIETPADTTRVMEQPPQEEVKEEFKDGEMKEEVREEELRADPEPEPEENIEGRTELMNALSDHLSGEQPPINLGELDIGPFSETQDNTCDVPISLAVSTSIRMILKRQLALTNQALLHILLESDNFLDILTYFKSVFLCTRGDKIDEFLDFLFKENGELNWSSLKDANILFSDLAFPTLPDGKSFKLSFELTRQITRIIPQNIASFQMLQFLALRMVAPPVVEMILSREMLDHFMDLISFLMKIRFLDILLRRAWQTINHDLFLQRRSERLAKMLHLNRHAIHSFLLKYQEYIYHFVIERAWTKLVKSIETARDVYEVKELVLKFLNGVKKRSFISTQSKTMTETLEKMILCVYEFTGLLNQVPVLSSSMLESMECESKLTKLGEDFRKYQEFITMMINYSTNKELRITQNWSLAS
eukprot:TRINITY_DN2180_c0_g1_i3.p1 TRINITY_DN2180_c0_g1~~TRINITY_DN2180_c0_g1_i3.p1  ORF type:complete len:498 (-),score=143.70 TRINITY_DN2180_c0_g1_i3:46-1467(-)